MIVEKIITCPKNEKIKDVITLTYHNRFIRRKKLVSDNAFVLENGSLILIKYAKEPLVEIVSENLMKIIWHIGNRHIPCQIELDRLLIQEDKVIEELILKLGGTINKIHEEFCPEGGAYGLGRTHGHKH